MPYNLKRDKYLEACFFDAYKVHCEIEKTEIKDAQGNWNRVIVKFRDGKGNVYGLIENYNEGDDNSTKDVELEDNKTGTTRIFETYIDAELALVDLLRSR
jgi:hypothetical protein